MPILVGGALIVGYFILQNPDLLSNLFPKPKDGNTSAVDDSGEFVDAGTDSSKDSSNCSSLCKSGDCDGYDDEGCSKGCSKCKSGGGSGGSSGGSSKKSSGGGSGGSNCNDGHSCQTRCTNGWCNSLRDCCKSFNCDKCSGGGGSSSSGGGGKSSCSSKCKSGLKVARESPCTCTKCGKISCGGGGGGSSGSSGGGSSSKCVVTKCPQCGAYPNYRVCKNNKCGCDKVGSKLAKVVSYRTSHIAAMREHQFRITVS